MADSKILVSVRGPVAVFTLNRPKKLNAIDPEMLRDLEQAVVEAEANSSVRAVVLTGAGDRAFCVGADIHAWAALKPLDMWRYWIREGHRVLERLARLRYPVIAAINGYAFGGGLELSLAADIRLAADSATFAMPEVSISTVPGWGGTIRLPTAIGAARAKEMMLTGRRINAQIADAWGLVNSVHPRSHLLQEAEKLALAIANNAPVAVQMTKELIDRRDAVSSVALEGLAGALAASTADGGEGVASFSERRDPIFQGE